jgi:hypothetical protein
MAVTKMSWLSTVGLPRYTVLAATVLGLGCAHQQGAITSTADLESGRGFTLSDLHPDNERSRLYAVNFQQAGLIPVCSEVEFLELEGDSLRFRVVSTGREYEYINHDAAAEPFPDHLRRFFGPSCPREEIELLSEVDRQGIREGRAIQGMSRRGVILAMGLPPRHVNPDVNAPRFTYWKHRFNRIEIQFGPEGTVTGIRE